MTIRSRIDGDSDGFEGDSVFKLENGQVWRQEEYYYCYRYQYRPHVVIENNKMTIEGIARSIRVRQID